MIRADVFAKHVRLRIELKRYHEFVETRVHLDAVLINNRHIHLRL